MIYYFAYEGKVYETTLQVVVDGNGRPYLCCVNYESRVFAMISVDMVRERACEFRRVEDLNIVGWGAHHQREEMEELE